MSVFAVLSVLFAQSKKIFVICAIIFHPQTIFRQICGQHRGWEDSANNAMIDEFTHTKEGTIVNEDGDRPCRDVAGKDRMPGDTWLSPDGCNICLCRGRYVYCVYFTPELSKLLILTKMTLQCIILC